MDTVGLLRDTEATLGKLRLALEKHSDPGVGRFTPEACATTADTIGKCEANLTSIREHLIRHPPTEADLDDELKGLDNGDDGGEESHGLKSRKKK